MEMDKIKSNVSKNRPKKDEQEGQPGPYRGTSDKGTLQPEQQPITKPRIANVEILLRPEIPLTRCKPGFKSRKRLPTISMESMAVSEEELDGYRSGDSVRSSVSGISTRSASVNKKTRVDLSFDEDKRSSVLSSGEEMLDSESGEPEMQNKKGRGRPITTGKGVLIREIRHQQEKLNRLQQQNEEAEKIAKREHDPADYRKAAEYDKMQNLEKELKILPTRAIAAQLLEEAKSIHGVAVRSGNLKGTMVRLLKDASIMMQVGVDIITNRTNPQESAEQRELAALREKVADQQKELELLRKSREVRAPEPPPLPTPPPPPSLEMEIQMAEQVFPSQTNKEEEEVYSQEQSLIDQKWPAIRPAIQGKRLVLRDRPEIPSKTTELEQQRDEDTMFRLEAMEAKIKAFSDMITKKVGSLLEEFQEEMYHKMNIKRDRSSARYKSGTPATKGSLMPDRPAPAKDQKGKSDHVPWSAVVGRKAAQKVKENKKLTGNDKKVNATQPATDGGKNSLSKTKKRRIPRTAAVVLTCPKGTYAETMADIRRKIPLTEVGINTGITTKIALTGALIIEVPGTENGPKADALASRMREVLNGKEGVKVDRPMKTAEIRVRRLEYSITEDEVRQAVAEKAGCKIYEVQAGTIKRTPQGQGSLWLKVPLTAINKLTKDGHIQIGWSQVKIEVLEKRPIRCFRCFEQGHVREQCQSPADRSQQCYRCGRNDHTAKDCAMPPKCPLCVDLGRPHAHVLGSKSCAPRQRKMAAEVRTQQTPRTRRHIEEDTTTMEVEETTISTPSTKITTTSEEGKPGTSNGI